jgi:membrane fusion protein (multidrug efflux system)
MPVTRTGLARHLAPTPAHLAPWWLVLAFTACSPKPHGNETEVFLVAQPGRSTADVQREYVGEVQALARAEVRSRIKGRIESLHIDEGQTVKAGQALFTIGAKELQHERRRARAAVASAAAELRAVEIERGHTKMLLDKAVVSPAEMALVDSRIQLLGARLEEAKAQQAQAEVTMGYAEVRAPFAGVVNRLPKKVGSVVDEGELLTTLTNTSEVFVYFRVSEQEYLEYTAAGSDSRTREIALKLANGAVFAAKGVMDAAENEFDRNTGTIAFRARFPNPSGLLKHGGTGKVLIDTKVKGALTVPQKSTFEVQDHVYVYVVDDGGKARARRIVPRLRVGDVFVVESGIEPEERFVAEGVQKIQDGTHVAVRYVQASGTTL